MNLQDRVAIVTGGGRGIGRAAVLRMAEEGAHVVIVQRTLEEAQKTASDVQALGRRAIAVKMDVTKREETRQLAKIVLDEFGRIDILVSNAGGSTLARTLFCDSNEDDWESTFALNLTGTLNCTRAVINHMIEKRSGKIIILSSIMGVYGAVGRTYYSAAKAGLIGFCKALAKEVGQHGINVNCVSPQPTATERILQRVSEEQLNDWKAKTYLNRLGTPEDIAAMVAFLASDEANFITGQNYLVDGGRSLGFDF
ncbi:SDR family NAD(P)-dependent oxidoreductase [Chloroflexota bacterium]